MNRNKIRKYVSPTREQQAAATKNRMLDAAESLLLEKGFAGMTVAEVAQRSGVSPQTVYAVFTSKAGIIMAAIEDRVVHNEVNIDTIKQLHSSTNPMLILQSIAKLTRNIYESHTPTFTAVYGACLVSPQLAELESELGELRLKKQQPLAASLLSSGKLLPHLDKETVCDILWAITSPELHYLLVVRRSWTPDRYEKQLFSMLATSFMLPKVISRYISGKIHSA